ncbi:MAG TPA: hypothetical protein VHX99_07195 [Rhizomicrobium sp.]|jgi:hypothetical protein|nr:hypothetical protein [Rhizomicrobium sp.]
MSHPNQSLRTWVEHGAMHGNPRLTHLLELANKGPALRAALVEELTELLTFWPSDCPQDMRAPCEALLTRAAQDMDDSVRADLRTKLHADPALAARVLPNEGVKANDNLGRTLIEMMRAGLDIHARMAEALNLSRSRLEEILATDHGLALICKRLGLSRTVFSALAMLTDRKTDAAQCYAVLDRYEAVTSEAVETLRAKNNSVVVSFRRELRDVRVS